VGCVLVRARRRRRRLDILAADGGLYADIDTVFLRPIPETLWAAPAVIGREADVRYGDAELPEPSMSNALLMAAPGSDFIVEWRRRIFDAMDGTWSGHSCRLATRLAVANPDLYINLANMLSGKMTPEQVASTTQAQFAQLAKAIGAPGF